MSDQPIDLSGTFALSVHYYVDDDILSLVPLGSDATKNNGDAVVMHRLASGGFIASSFDDHEALTACEVSSARASVPSSFLDLLVPTDPTSGIMAGYLLPDEIGGALARYSFAEQHPGADIDRVRFDPMVETGSLSAVVEDGVVIGIDCENVQHVMAKALPSSPDTRSAEDGERVRAILDHVLRTSNFPWQ